MILADRDSTGNNKFNHNIEFGKDVEISGKLKWVDTENTTYSFLSTLSTPRTASLGVHSSTGEHLAFHQDNSISKTWINFLEAGNIKVNRGTASQPEWKDVITTSLGDATKPENLRIYDINPTTTHDEPYSLVEFRWNYDDIDGTKPGPREFDVKEVSFNKESIILTGGINVVDKRLYFTSSNNIYKIVSQSGQVLTVDQDLQSEDVVDTENPARIIDSNLSSYRLVIKNSETNQAYIHELGKSFIKNPKFTKKLELGEQWTVSLQPLDIGFEGDILSMPAGSFDPDHSSDDFGQTKVNYGSKFTNRLPHINTVVNSDGEGAGTLTVEGDSQGFSIIIGGWTDSQEPSNSAHEYEIIYSSQEELNINSSFDNLDGSGIEHLIMKSKKAHISSGKPTRFSVLARPLQNKYPVDAPVSAEVIAGGGGVAPNEYVLVDTEVDIDIITGQVQTDQSGTVSGEYKIIWVNGNGDQINPQGSRIRGRKFKRPSDGETVWINEHYNSVGDNNSGIYRIWVPDTTIDTQTVTTIESGNTKADRLISEQELDIDSRITKIQFKCDSAKDVSQQNPAIIRVYQKGFEGDAVSLEVAGRRDEPWIQNVSLPVKLSSSGTRSVIVDAWDPDGTSPNNGNEIFGTLKVLARPEIKDNLGS